ncbi:acyltransferase family protein [Pseudomonas sp. NKUCC02_KPG]|uniref:acyltransferase family protein n=1 Tax=Pseudomonas sp. NKUCC02_KPG TaxID=2842124 RepID=UPI001C5A7D5F|nr:acyltransferase family protein [Pseudomonas sp. NKUCC02_KPG]MBW3503692.1 acyltransferase [Pseudomonas sp. NKUCC02_KPG]
MNSNFRTDINALRALAVVAVVLFHFKIAGFDGGFVGVDVFFVVSGFLMTQIICGGLAQNQFSLAGFYASRLRRIVPALIGLCLAVLAFGFIYLPLDDFRGAIKAIKSSLLFASNFSFMAKGDYFDAPQQANWLLHTWSLSVEWQFYMIYPIFLMVCRKHQEEQNTKHALVIVGLISLFASVFLSRSNPSFAFYMLPTRAWELIIGGLVFLYPIRLNSKTGSWLAGVGIALILLSIFILSEQNAWPGYLALLPVSGTALILTANKHRLLSGFKPVQFIGTISYSVYLWHWPFVVFLYQCGLLNNGLYVLAAIALTFVLGTLSFYLVESKAKKSDFNFTTILKYSSVTLATVGVSAITASIAKDYPSSRFAYVDLGQPEYTSKMYSRECYSNPYGAADCMLGKGEVSAILFGDSHAESTAAAFQPENSGAALLWARGGCPTLLNFEMNDKELQSACRAFNADKVEALKNSYAGVPVILFSRAGLYSTQSRTNGYSVYFNKKQQTAEQSFAETFSAEYANTVCSIAHNHPVYIVRPIPEMPFNVYKGLNLNQRIFAQKSDISIPVSDYQQRNRIANKAIDRAARQCPVKVLDPTPYLCPRGQCMGSKNGQPLYYDDNHLIDFGNAQLIGLFANVLTKG